MRDRQLFHLTDHWHHAEWHKPTTALERFKHSQWCAIQFGPAFGPVGKEVHNVWRRVWITDYHYRYSFKHEKHLVLFLLKWS